MIKIDKRIELIKRKIEETEKIYRKDQGDLGEFSDKLVRLIADNVIELSNQREKEIKKVTDQIGELKNKIEFSPKIIKALTEKIALLEREKADQILGEKISEQKAIGTELAKISKSFIGNLKKAIKENSEIRSLWVSWNKLKEQTSFDQFEKKVSTGSEEMLGILGILVGEYDEGKIRRASVFNRIRL